MSVVEQITPGTATKGAALPDDAADSRSLIDDVQVLIEDGKTYLEAELNFQKTRARFASEQAKGIVLYGAVGLVFAWMALIGLTVGLIFALAPALGPWGATAVVVVVWLVIAGIAAGVALGRWRELVRAFGSGSEKTP